MQLGEIRYNPSQGAFEALAVTSTAQGDVRIACRYYAPLDTPTVKAVRGLVRDAQSQRKGETQRIQCRRAARPAPSLIAPISFPCGPLT
jgi:hypothetical protein